MNNWNALAGAPAKQAQANEATCFAEDYSELKEAVEVGSWSYTLDTYWGQPSIDIGLCP